jgi:hypothetical protein
MKKYVALALLFASLASNAQLQSLQISDNHHYLTTSKKKPFFWMGDTAWLLLKKLNREDAEIYLEDRKNKGYNVIQVMVIHDMNDAVNVYGDSALVNKNIATPFTTPGKSFENATEYDFWDHADYIIDLAKKKEIYVALVPVWGSNVKGGGVSVAQAEAFGTWLAKRYKKEKHMIWLNGGDIKGSDGTEVWKAMGTAIKKQDPKKLMSFHPFGRTQSSTWFHDEPWLDFNMFQSGHRRYDQDDSTAFSQDNYKYLERDFYLKPLKPSIDGEPSYEHIPHGLHDTSQPLWNEHDVRRYAYWSVFAGAFGHTYGHNAIMQFYKKGENGAYGETMLWQDALDATGASQMKYLKELILSKPYFERVPAQEILLENGLKYNKIIATRGQDYAMIYTYRLNPIKIDTNKLNWGSSDAYWLNPKDGSKTYIYKNRKDIASIYTPTTELKDGNDWVLVIEKSGK